MISLYELKIFHTVIQSGSFSRAAQSLFLTQSSISQHIDSLEKQLGVQLFIRGNRGVSLTSDGKRLEKYADKLLKLTVEMERDLTRVENLEDGRLRIGATIHTAGYMLPEWLQKLQQSYPRIKVSLVTDEEMNILRNLAIGSLDLGFMEEDIPLPQKGVGDITLKDSELFIMVGRSHEWFTRETVSLRELDGRAMIAFPQQSSYRRWLDRFFAEQHLQPMISSEYGEPEAIKRLLMAGDQFAVLPGCTITDEQQQGKLHLLTLKEAHLTRPIKLLWRTVLPISPVAKAFIDILAQEYHHLRTHPF
jgi:DNA-binding transcriptional LysR family regulator